MRRWASRWRRCRCGAGRWGSGWIRTCSTCSFRSCARCRAARRRGRWSRWPAGTCWCGPTPDLPPLPDADVLVPGAVGAARGGAALRGPVLSAPAARAAGLLPPEAGAGAPQGAVPRLPFPGRHRHLAAQRPGDRGAGQEVRLRSARARPAPACTATSSTPSSAPPWAATPPSPTRTSAALTHAGLALPEGEFYHFGTSRDLCRSYARLQNLVLDQRQLSAPYMKPHPDMFVQNARLGRPLGPRQPPGLDRERPRAGELDAHPRPRHHRRASQRLVAGAGAGHLPGLRAGGCRRHLPARLRNRRRLPGRRSAAPRRAGSGGQLARVAGPPQPLAGRGRPASGRPTCRRRRSSRCCRREQLGERFIRWLTAASPAADGQPPLGVVQEPAAVGAGAGQQGQPAPAVRAAEGAAAGDHPAAVSQPPQERLLLPGSLHGGRATWPPAAPPPSSRWTAPPPTRWRGPRTT